MHTHVYLGMLSQVYPPYCTGWVGYTAMAPDSSAQFADERDLLVEDRTCRPEAPGQVLEFVGA